MHAIDAHIFGYIAQGNGALKAIYVLYIDLVGNVAGDLSIG